MRESRQAEMFHRVVPLYQLAEIKGCIWDRDMLGIADRIALYSPVNERGAAPTYSGNCRNEWEIIEDQRIVLFTALYITTYVWN